MTIPAPDEFRCKATFPGSPDRRCHKVSHRGEGPHMHVEEMRGTYNCSWVRTWVDDDHPWPESEFALGEYVAELVPS